MNQFERDKAIFAEEYSGLLHLSPDKPEFDKAVRAYNRAASGSAHAQPKAAFRTNPPKVVKDNHAQAMVS